MTKDLLVESETATVVEDPDTIPMSEKRRFSKKKKQRITTKREKE